MTTETITPEAFAALQSDLEKSRREFSELLMKMHELSSVFAALRITMESDTGPAIDLARIMEEHVCDVVDDYRRRTT